MVFSLCICMYIHMKGITYNKELIYIVGLNATATWNSLSVEFDRALNANEKVVVYIKCSKQYTWMVFNYIVRIAENIWFECVRYTMISL